MVIEQHLLPVGIGKFMVHQAAQPTILPDLRKAPADVPQRAAKCLAQAIGSLSAPDAAVTVAGSAVDAMKAIKLTEGSVKARIIQAREQGFITQGMAEWANEVRLAANEQRHSDESFEHATTEDAERLVEFALAFAEFLFVLPARVARGRGRNEGDLPP